MDDNGVAELLGVPDELCAAWSARRQQVKALGNDLVVAREAELGRPLTSAERATCFQIAAYRTRAPKVDANTPTATLKARWQEEAAGFGHPADAWLPGVLGRERVVEGAPGAKALATVVARLEERSATWGRSDVVEECSRLVTGPDAGGVHRLVEALTDEVLRDPEVVSLAAPLPAEAPESLRRQDQMAQFERHGAVRFTTTGTLRREASVLEAAAEGVGAGVAVVPGEIVEAVLAGDVLAGGVLGEDQAAAVRGLLTGGEQVALLVGPAGAGKSRALEAARRAWSAAGHEVLGLAPSAMAAAVLEEASGIRSETLAKALHDLGRGASSLAPSSVVVLDEAGMARTDDLARLVEAVKVAGSKLVLVGDPHQLGAVGPGGLFRTLVDDHGAHELETIRRFEHAWEAAASLRLRSRDPSILPTYLAQNRIAEGSRNAMAEQALSAWRAAREEGKDLLVMTGDNAGADELSRRCRAELVRTGLVEAEGVRIASGVAGIGDEVVTLRNDRRLRASEDDFVRNGARWQVVDRGADGSLSVVPLAGEGAVTLPPEYVADHVGLAYALTVHKAQGATSDRAVVLVEESMSAAQLYVAMSRGREENRALVVTSDHDPDEHARGVGLAGIELLVQVLRRDGTDRSAHEVLRSNLARSEDLDLAAGLRDVMTERIEELAGPDLRRQITALEAQDDLPAARSGLEVAECQLRDAEAQRVQAEERVALVGSSLRAHLPGRIGNGARREQAVAESALNVTRREEQQALRHLEVSRQRVSTAEEHRRELASLRARQNQRNAYLGEHPDEVAFVGALNRLLRTGRGIAEPPPTPSGQAPPRRAPAPAPRREVNDVMAPPTKGQEQGPSRRREQRDGLSRRVDGARSPRNIPSGTVPWEPPPGHESRSPSLGM